MKWFVTGFLIFFIGISFNLYALNWHHYANINIPIGGFWPFIYLLFALTGMIYMGIGLSKILKKLLKNS